MLAPPAPAASGMAPPMTEELSAHLGAIAEPEAAPQEQVIILLDEAKQKLEHRKDELLRRQAPQPVSEPPRRRRSTAAEPKPRRMSRRAVTLTGANRRAVLYGVAAMVLMVMTLGLLTVRSRETGQDLLAGAADLVNTTQANVAASTIPIRVEALRYHLEITDPNGAVARDTGLEPLPAGSRFKFHFKMREGGYLYLIARGKNGAPQTFLTTQPMAASGVTTNWGTSGKDFQFPDGGQWLMLQREADAAPFTVVYSPTQLEAPAFLAMPSGHELTAAEQQEWQAFRQRYAGYKPDLMATEDGNQPAVVVQMPTQAKSGEPLIFDIAVKRK